MKVKELKEMFDFFDKNKDGVLSKAELIELTEVLLAERGQGKSSKVLKDFDRNRDGFIDFKEFKDLLETNFGIIVLE